MNVYRQIAEGGAWSLHYMVKIIRGTKSINLINGRSDVVYRGETYRAASFNYTPSTDGSVEFNIDIVNHDVLIDLLESGDELICSGVGIFLDGEIAEMSRFSNRYGEATWNGEKLDVKFEGDDRGKMTFPALIFNSYNNRGNA